MTRPDPYMVLGYSTVTGRTVCAECGTDEAIVTPIYYDHAPHCADMCDRCGITIALHYPCPGCACRLRDACFT